MAPEFFILRTFLIGFALGVFLFFIVYNVCEPPPTPSIAQFVTDPFDDSTVINKTRLKDYDTWFKELGVSKHQISNDDLRYRIYNGEVESKWLFKKVIVLCAVYTSNDKYAKAINETWSKSCNEMIFYHKNVENNLNTRVPSKSATTSSYHLLCDIVRRIVTEYSHIQWALFIKDDMFVIAENLRHLVAPLNPDEGHYLGHAISFWGVHYNMALSGFVLSRGAMRRLVDKFPDTSACVAGGKYWKQEDLYLGKHLKSMDIHPVDTRDKEGFTVFLGYDLDKMMFPGSTQHFTTYNTRALYPVKCCGSQIITFPVLSSTEMYTYHYMIYTMLIFKHGSYGNKLPPTPFPESHVWEEFLRQEGLPMNLSNVQYEEHWYIKFGNVTALPGVGQEKEYKRKDKQGIGGPNKLFNPTNMPEVLESMLSNYTAKKASHNYL